MPIKTLETTIILHTSLNLSRIILSIIQVGYIMFSLLFCYIPWILGLLLSGILLYSGYEYISTYIKIKYFTNLSSLRGKTVLLTGSTSGIGLEMAKQLYHAGAHLILPVRDMGRADKLINDEIISLSPQLPTYIRPTLVLFDMNTCDETALNYLLEQISTYVNGTLHSIIFCAGLSMRCSVNDLSIITENTLMNVNYTSITILTRLLLQRHMIDPISGRIMYISSAQGLIPLPLRTWYSASKHALQAYVTSLRYELILNGSKITTTLISPGYVATNLSLNALTGSGNKYGKMDVTTSSGSQPYDIAQISLYAMVNGINELWLFPIHHKIMIFLQHLVPKLATKILVSKAKKDINDTNAANNNNNIPPTRNQTVAQDDHQKGE